jgi:hypothetical protein
MVDDVLELELVEDDQEEEDQADEHAAGVVRLLLPPPPGLRRRRVILLGKMAPRRPRPGRWVLERPPAPLLPAEEEE